MRSRTVSLPCLRCRSTYFAPPPSRAAARCFLSSATSDCIRSRLALNVGLFLSTCDSSVCIQQPFGNLDFGRQEKLGERLALRVQHKRERSSAAKTLVQEEIQREQVRQLV